VKDVSSSFIGVSPAFEVAIYTLCFLDGDEHNTLQVRSAESRRKSLTVLKPLPRFLQVGPYPVEVTCFRMRHRGKEYIGTSFPTAIPGYTPAAVRVLASSMASAPQVERDGCVGRVEDSGCLSRQLGSACLVGGLLVSAVMTLARRHERGAPACVGKKKRRLREKEVPLMPTEGICGTDASFKNLKANFED
jgi:hypothetical protein